jgi:hypothetical protein
LQSSSVAEATKQSYLRSVEQFYSFCDVHGLRHEKASDLDQALTEYMNASYLDGEHSFVGSRLLSALSFVRPSLGRPRDMCVPLAKQALRGWKKLAPGSSRSPLPWEFICGIAMLQIAQGQWDVALAILIGTVFYLRPGELLGLRVRHAVPPLPEAGPRHRRWSLVLHEFAGEGSRPSKTGVFDECLILDLPKHQFLGAGLQRLTANREAQAALFQCTPAQLAAALKEGAARLGVPTPPLAYQLRHSGPSIDFADGTRTLAEIKRRGRWRADSSMRRYEKGSQLTRFLRGIPAGPRDFVVRACRSLPDVIQGRCQAFVV